MDILVMEQQQPTHKTVAFESEAVPRQMVLGVGLVCIIATRGYCAGGRRTNIDKFESK